MVDVAVCRCCWCHLCHHCIFALVLVVPDDQRCEILGPHGATDCCFVGVLVYVGCSCDWDGWI